MPIRKQLNKDVVLVVGGAGYIGSHMVWYLQQAGYTPIIFDNLSTGHRGSVHDAELIVGYLLDTDKLNQIFSNYQIAGVMHFASCIDIAESICNPGKYYRNNVVGSLNLLETMYKHNVKKIIFSSSASVYGEPQYTPIDESHPLQPVSPYGRSKLMVEEIIEDFHRSHGLHFAILRYFNAAGAHPDGLMGENHVPETHLIPLLLQVAVGEKDYFTLYGNDYPTEDGTCIRDYVHVMDICEAHFQALQVLGSVPAMICNLGSGGGHSILEVINCVSEVTGKLISLKTSRRRVGDPAILVADIREANKQLRWQPKLSGLNNIISDAWNYERILKISSKNPLVAQAT